MDAKSLKETLTVNQIIDLMVKLGADYRTGSNDNEIYFTTICHDGDSHKLYFYKDTKEFHCYTNCGQLDIINIVENVKRVPFTQAVRFIKSTLGISDSEMTEGFNVESGATMDLEILNRYSNIKSDPVDMTREFKVLDENLLNRFYKYYHPAFYEDGISLKTLYKFGIRYDILNERIIIPHRDELGRLIAIRSRNLNEELVDIGLKYVPIVLDNKLLSAKTSKYLYGQNYNQDNIKIIKKAILLESEKAVMQLDTILDGCNIGLALMSSSLSSIQVELLKELGVEEVIIALDKEYETYGSVQEKAYAVKVRKGIINKLTPYFTVTVMWDKENLLNYKDSPTDKGKNVFMELLEKRIRIN